MDFSTYFKLRDIIFDKFEQTGHDQISIKKAEFPVGTKAMEISSVCFKNGILMQITQKQFWFQKTELFEEMIKESK